MRTELIVALDEPTFERALDVVARTSARVQWYKVGYEAYVGYGDRILGALREHGKSLFLDLKLHDIPNTVAAGVRAAAGAGARLLTVHAAGGPAMLSAAAQARNESGAPSLQLLAVTVLTSMNAAELRETGVDRNPEELVMVRARLAQRCGIDGVVCAVGEAAAVREATGDGFMILCPGIRPAGADAGDQRRVASPADAARAGANFIVVGRPIARAADPAAAAAAIIDELHTAVLP
jgi:orotidine-5'-phosphate decarboxylase